MSQVPPTIRLPTRADLEELAATFHMELSEGEIGDFLAVAGEAMATYEELDALTPSNRALSATDRDSGYRPDPSADPYNAFVTKCRVEGTKEGPSVATRSG